MDCAVKRAPAMTTPPTPVIIEAAGSTRLVRTGTQFTLLDAGGNGPTLRYGGAAVDASHYGDWSPIGAETTAGGYEVVWHQALSSLFAIWTTDLNGNYTASTGTVLGTSPTLMSAEIALGQDLNDDGRIGPPISYVENQGTTWLVKIGTGYEFATGAGAGPTLKVGGIDLDITKFGNWAPFAAEAIAGGYQVAWKLAGADQYVVWTTDSFGSFATSTGVVSGHSAALEGAEPTFHQDLNGDGVIGFVTTLIQDAGALRLYQVGSNYVLRDTIGTDLTLKQDGSAVDAGKFGNWAPIAAEAIPGGFKVAWHEAGTNNYAIWTTDSFASRSAGSGVLAGSSNALQMQEKLFAQDLNGDGRIGPAETVIENFGNIRLVQVGDQFELRDGSNTGPTLQYGGSAVSSAAHGAWQPVAAEQTASGYEVAWHQAGSNIFIVWQTDAQGNYATSSGMILGSGTTLQGFETSFHQDLNGDGHIGPWL